MRAKIGLDYTDAMMQEPGRKPRNTAEVPEEAPANDDVTNAAAAHAAEDTVADRVASEAAPSEAETLRQENAGLKDRLLRGRAAMGDRPRRPEGEVADAKAYGVTSFARDMLAVADNLRRALDHLPA